MSEREPVEESAPLDTTIAQLIQSVHPDRGFALSVAAELKPEEGEDEKRIVYEVKESTPVHDEWESPAPYRNHVVEDVESIALLAKKYSTPEAGLILYTDRGVQLVYGERVDAGQREIITLNFAYSAEWKAWNAILTGQALDHRTLLAALILNQHTINEPTIIDRMREVKATFSAKLDSDLRIEKEVVGVVFTAAAGEELVKFPKAFGLSLPVLDLDVIAAPTWASAEIRLEFLLPTEPKQPVRFQLLCPEWNSIRRTRINEEIAHLKSLLPEWTIVRGTHKQTARTLGR